MDPSFNSSTYLSLGCGSGFQNGPIGGNFLEMEDMGITVPSFRMALEGETASWKEFRGSLRSVGSREDLDSMFDQARTYCMATGNAVRPVVLLEDQEKEASISAVFQTLTAF